MKLPSDAPRFVATVGPPYPDESLLGFLTRALSGTFVESLSTALRKAHAMRPNPTSIATTLKDETEIARIAHLVGCRPKDIADRTYPIRFTQTKRKMVVLDFFCTEIRPRHRVTKVRRVSPRALQRAQYHRAIWELRIFSFDPETRELLIDTCPVCTRTLGWRRALGPTVCDKCVDDDGLPTVDLRDFEQPLIKVADEEALDFVTGLVAPDPGRKEAARSLLPEEFRCFSNSSLFEAVTAVALGLAGCAENGPLKINVAHIPQLTPELLCLAGRAVIGGQAGFDALCERFRLATGRRAGRHGRHRELGRLVGLSDSESSLHPDIRAIFRRMIDFNLASAIEAELSSSGEAGPALPIMRMASKLKVRPERLRRLSHSGAVPVVRAEGEGKVPVRMAVKHVAPIVRSLPDALRAKEVSIKIDAPIYAVRDLAEHGLIQRLDQSVASMLATSAAYSKSSVDELIARLKTAHCKHASGIPLMLACTLIRTGATPWGAVVKAILEVPDAVARYPKSKRFSLRKLVVTDANAFTTAVRRHLTSDETIEDGWIGPAEAAEVLKITYAFFWRLARARPDLVKPRREGSVPYLVADIQALAESYIFVGEIAFRRELHPRLAVAWLKSIGVEPAFAVRRKQDLAYLRSEVESWLGPCSSDSPTTRPAARPARIFVSKPLTEHT
ncbi:hypothetical protein ACVI1J_006634 [Bradyrhizobium diazoefficiens]